MTIDVTRLCALLFALCLTGAACAEPLDPTTMVPLVPAGYQPVDVDEQGLWQSSNEIEQQIANSHLLFRNPDLQAYLDSVLARVLGDRAADLRLYVVRDPDFNASVFPNGMILVHTGLLARLRNEAQLAAVLGHEAGHYLRMHTIDQWRVRKSRAAAMSVFTLGGAFGPRANRNNWYFLAHSINAGLLASLFSYSREMEAEADAYGVLLMTEAGYAPGAAAEVWSQLISERKASAEARNTPYKDRAASLWSSHPPTEQRMDGLAQYARSFSSPSGQALSHGTNSWAAAMADLLEPLLSEQIKQNDAGASLFLVKNLAQDGWTSALHFALGNIYSLRADNGDAELAAQAYADAVTFPDPVRGAFRAHGYAQLKLGNTQLAQDALRTYLQRNPEATDASMIRYTLDNPPQQ